MIEFCAWLIGGMFSFLGSTYIYYKFVDAKSFISFKFIILYLFCVVSLASIYYFDISLLGLISYFIFCPFLYANIKLVNSKKFVYYIFAIWVYGILLDFVAMAIVSLIHHFYDFNVYGYVFEIALSIAISCMFIVISHVKIAKSFTNNLYEKLFSIEHFDFFFIFFVIVTFSIGLILFINLNRLSISLMLTLLLFLLIVMFIFLIKYRMTNMETAIFIKNLRESYEFYIKMNDENRIFRHNLNAKLSSIKSVSNQKAKLLIVDLLKENNNNVTISELVKVIPYGFSGVIFERLYPYMDVLNITIDNSINEDLFDILKARKYNVFVEKMVVALDNAIEASLASSDKVLSVNLYVLENEIVLEIKNTFSNIINLDDMGKIGYSTKGTKRGLGLFSTFRNSEATVNVQIFNNIFISKVVVKRKNQLSE